ncbi:Protein kinase domain-containing protein [Abeliophyllum distichum]|uniref:Protein kinase domain-containing protein n=1 Tax=Abeliophyllum distichum TaxID=126358 RepID=A0ABD1RTX9_9LAMI
MPRIKMAARRSRSERPPSSSSSEEEDPQTKLNDRCPVLIGKNVDLASFTFDVPSFNIENIFVGHLDEVNHYDIFLLDSIIRGRKLDFSYIMILHMNCVLSGTRAKALPYGMILTKNFQHIEVPIRDSVALLPKATDTIKTITLKRKIFKEDGNGWQSPRILMMSRDPLPYHSRVKKWM